MSCFLYSFSFKTDGVLAASVSRLNQVLPDAVKRVSGSGQTGGESGRDSFQQRNQGQKNRLITSCVRVRYFRLKMSA